LGDLMQPLLQKLLYNPKNAPSLSFNFIDGSAFSPQITFARASTATFFDSAGVLQSAANDVPRIDYNPATLAAQGLLIEESRTNSIRNNTMVGAVAGTPGTLPTNWGIDTPGLTTSVIGTGTSAGITYVDIKLSGTTSNSYGNIFFETSTAIAATNAQTWAHSLWIAVVSGATTNITTIRHAFDQFSNVPAYLATVSSSNFVSSVTGTLQRSSAALTTNNASTASVRPSLSLLWSNGVAIDITLRIGLPQLELGAFATSVIPTTTTALTRAADVASVNTLSPWYNAAASTVYVEAVTSPGLSSFPTQLSISDGTANNRISTYLHTTGYYSNIRSGGSSQGDPGVLTAPTVGSVYKFAVGVETNNAISSANGTLGSADTTITMPVGVNQLRIGANETGGTYSNTWIRRITYYPVRLPDAQLQAITA
jgi:hypothetical protein